MKFTGIGFISVLVVACSFVLLREGRGQLPKGALSVMTYNVGTFNSSPTDMEAVEGVIRKSGVPDILLIQELPGKAQARQLTENLRLQNYLYVPYGSGVNGVSILARGPLRHIKTFDFDGHAALAAEAQIDGGRILLCSVHLTRIKDIRVTETGVDLSAGAALRLLKTELLKETPRSRSVEDLLAWISDRQYKNVIIGGDFNTVPFTKAVRKMNGRFKDALWPSFQYLAGTYNMAPFPVAPRIDYIFYSPGFRCVSASIVKERAGDAGDHYPVKALFDPEA